MTSLDHLQRAVVKRYRAAQWGCPFWGSSHSFKVPATIRLDGRTHVTKLPEENGVKVAFMELLLDDCYGLRHIRSKVETVLDIGAHVGVFCLAARRAFPGAVIHAYEPNAAVKSYLHAQAVAAGATYFLEAVAREAGHVSLEVHTDTVNTRSKPDSAGAIPAISFRTAVERLGGRVDVAKVDCEGAEWDFLADAEPWQNVRHLAMEYHLTGGHSHADAYSAVTALGFAVSTQARADTFGVIHAARI